MSIEGWKKGLEGARAVRAPEPSYPSRSAVVPTESRIPVAQQACTRAPAAPRLRRRRPRLRRRSGSAAGQGRGLVAGDEPVGGRRGDGAHDRGSAPRRPAPTAASRALRRPPVSPAAPTASAGEDPPSAPVRPAAARVAHRRVDRQVPQAPADAPQHARRDEGRGSRTPPPPEISHVPTARGTLGATPLAHVLVYMLDHALTGSIVFREPDELEHMLYFQLGAVSKVNVARPTSRIGDELVVAGLVTRADDQRGGRRRAPPRRAPR